LLEFFLKRLIFCDNPKKLLELLLRYGDVVNSSMPATRQPSTPLTTSTPAFSQRNQSHKPSQNNILQQVHSSMQPAHKMGIEALFNDESIL
jgi:hypothetical protein